MMRALQLAVLLAACSTSSAQNPYVYFVEASGCAGGIPARSQTGFRLLGIKGIVTALHGVVGCSSVTARSEGGPILYEPLHIECVDVDSDVALLESSELSEKPADGFQLEDDPVFSAGSKVTVQGHPYGIRALTTTFALRNPPTAPLRNLVPDDVLALLDNRGSPNSLTQVLSLESGNLLPGHSGAPVLNAKGRLIGVADGGLKGGTVQISWAIPYAQIRWVNPPSTYRFRSLQKTSDADLFQYEGEVTGSDKQPDDDEDAQASKKFNEAVEHGDFKTVSDMMPSVTPVGVNWALNELALKGGPDAMVRLMLDSGADVNAGIQGLDPPLFLAVSNKQVSVVRILAEQKDLKINAVRAAKTVLFGIPVEQHILHDAIKDCHQRLDILAILLEVPRIDVNVRDHLGKTPLQTVVGCNWEEAVDLFLKTPGLDINALDSEGESALDLTYDNCFLNAAGCRIANRLQRAGAKPYKYTAAEFASRLADSKREHQLQ